MWGRLGNDTIDAAAGRDRVAGGPGDDVVRGGAGRDRLFGNLGADTLDGGPGGDRLWALALADDATPGADRVYGGLGNDTIHTRDREADVVDCGPGRDTALLDAMDIIADATPTNANGSCERVVRKAPNRDDDRTEGATQEPSAP
jgi:Ca2+-binding RTX toxin-like protein